MARDDERRARAAQQPIVAGLPDVPGIGVAMRLTPGLGIHLRGLADQLLVDDYPGATISRHEREFLATTVSASNDCFFCMDSHGAHATAIIARTGGNDRLEIIDDLKTGATERLGPKMAALAHISRTVAHRSLDLTAADVDRATAAGASDGDVQLAVLIAAGFSMYNRMVDGFRARTAPVVEAYDARAAEIAERGYAAPSALTPPSPASSAAPSAAPAAAGAKGS